MGRIEGYVSAQGTYFPCCWVGNEPYATALKGFLGDDLWSQLDTRTHGMPEILSSDALRTLFGSWDDGSFEPCRLFCGKPIEERNRDLNRDRRDTNLVVNFDTGEIKYD